MDELGRLGIDDNGRLFWDGKEVVTTMRLPWSVNVAIIIGALAAVVAASWPIVRFALWGSWGRVIDAMALLGLEERQALAQSEAMNLSARMTIERLIGDLRLSAPPTSPG
jgi:hypothetical protein